MSKSRNIHLMPGIRYNYDKKDVTYDRETYGGLQTTNPDLIKVAFKDISGSQLPGISKWSGSLGGEFSAPAIFLGEVKRFFVAADGCYRSSFSSSPSPSAYLNINGYALVNGRLGFRAVQGLSAFVWVRNLFNKNYFEQLLPAGGNAGQYAAVLGDPRTYGVTLRYSINL